MKMPSTAPDLVYSTSTRGLQHSKEMQYDEYDRDDEQYVDHVAGLRDPRADAPTEKAEQPQHD
jgi:hypothetical protein